MKGTVFPIDVATWEVVTGITMIDAEGWKQIRERKEREASRELRRIDHGPLGKFYLSACRTNQFEGLRPQDVTRLIYLASHLNYKNVLMVNEHRAMTLTDLPEVLGVSEATAKRFWDKVNGRYVSPCDDGTLSVKDTFLEESRSIWLNA